MGIFTLGKKLLHYRFALKYKYEKYPSYGFVDDCSTITVTGHSKGGNKAKDNSVDICIAFDGQGFSDEFID